MSCHEWLIFKIVGPSSTTQFPPQAPATSTGFDLFSAAPAPPATSLFPPQPPAFPQATTSSFSNFPPQQQQQQQGIDTFSAFTAAPAPIAAAPISLPQQSNTLFSQPSAMGGMSFANPAQSQFPANPMGTGLGMGMGSGLSSASTMPMSNANSFSSFQAAPAPPAPSGIYLSITFLFLNSFLLMY